MGLGRIFPLQAFQPMWLLLFLCSVWHFFPVASYITCLMFQACWRPCARITYKDRGLHGRAEWEVSHKYYMVCLSRTHSSGGSIKFPSLVATLQPMPSPARSSLKACCSASRDWDLLFHPSSCPHGQGLFFYTGTPHLDSF